jgi:tungstate transport system ATP-binding protein
VKSDSPLRAHLEGRGLRHLYCQKEVLDIPRISFQEGKIYALVGPNGSGKTTLMLILSLLLLPTTGRVYYRGMEVTDANRRSLRGKITMLFQDPLLFHTSVRGNVEYGLKIRRIEGMERRRRVSESLSMVGLEGFGERRAQELSSGEAQRVAIARAVAIRPEVLLLDEPTANVDEANVRILEGIIRSLSRDLGTTIVFSTHDRNQAYRVADEIITLMEGRIIPFRPENLFQGKSVKDADGTWFDTGRIKIFLPTREQVRAIHIDPRDILVSLTPFSSSARNCLEGIIESIIANGDWVRLQIQAQETFQVLITQKSLHEMGLNVGMRVYLTFKSSAVQVY